VNAPGRLLDGPTDIPGDLDAKDRFGAYDNHANSYVQKPVNYDTFVVAAHQLGLYWTALNVAAPRTPI
jgi:hypothetical protein